MKVLRTASLISLTLAIAKGFAFATSGSLVILASFLDSLMDTFLSWLNFKLSRASKERPDRQHPYGHGGFEVVGALIQGFLIAGSGGLVIFQTLDRFFSPVGYQNLKSENLPTALGILILSMLGGGVITWLLTRSKRQLTDGQQRSLSVNSDHAHYTGDLIQNAIGIVALIITIYLGNPYIDSIAGGISGLLLVNAAWPLIRDSLRDIMNTEFDPALQKTLQNIVMDSNIPEVKGMHRLRSRTLGPNHFVDFHLKLPNEITLLAAHEISYQIEGLIAQKIPNVDVMIHLDPEDEPDDDI